MYANLEVLPLIRLIQHQVMTQTSSYTTLGPWTMLRTSTFATTSREVGLKKQEMLYQTTSYLQERLLT